MWRSIIANEMSEFQALFSEKKKYVPFYDAFAVTILMETMYFNRDSNHIRESGIEHVRLSHNHFEYNGQRTRDRPTSPHY